MEKKLSITVGQYSSAGVKAENEDFYGVYTPEDDQLDSKGIAIAIADGMSGSDGGKEASEISVKQFLSDYYSTPESWTVKHAVNRIMSALNSMLFSQGQKRYSTSKGLVTTFSAVVFKSQTAHLFHVGDSRIYRLRDGEFQQLTNDHRIWISNDTEYLSRALGIDSHLEIDYRRIPIQEQDVYLLSTDGVHDFLSDKTLKQQLDKHQNDPQQASETIVKSALENRSDDNVTCQVLRIDSIARANQEEFYDKLTRLPFPPHLKIGNKIDGFKIIRELHATSRSQVYLAEDTTVSDQNDTHPQVVIKTPSVNFEDDPAYIDLFLHEEWVGKRINHPHVMKVYEHKKHRQFLYYAAEYIEGQTLRQWMNDHPKASLVETREIVNQIKNGLRAFHRMEMIHQDIKPENIMIDQNGTVKIIDFGSTKIAGLEEITTPLERINLLGTKNYTAPESLLGYSGSVQTDVFSLGVITYEILTGKLPYKNNKTYIPASSIPIWIDNVLRTAVHPDPKKRYETPTEFIKALSQPTTQSSSMLERYPLTFWKRSAVISFMLNLILILCILILLQ